MPLNRPLGEAGPYVGRTSAMLLRNDRSASPSESRALPHLSLSTSTGHLLSERTGKDFLDTDDLIRADTGKSLQQIVDESGYLVLRDIEQRVICDLECEQSIIATGGSAVYSAAAMAHLADISTLVYLAAPFAVIEQRIRDLDTRGLARRPGQGLEELYRERVPLYQQYADLTVNADDETQNVVDHILASLGL